MGALGASGASRWVLFEPLERRDGRSQCFWSLEITATRAFGASRELLPEPLGPRIAAPRASGASRRLLPELLEPRDGCCVEETVEETVEGASKFFEGT